MHELRPGIWHWQAPHPDWTPEERWPQAASSHAIDDGARLILIDPLTVPNEILELATDREPLIVLTAPWHGGMRKGVTRDEVVGRLRPLLDRSVEVVLSAHGAPTVRAALERALATRLVPAKDAVIRESVRHATAIVRDYPVASPCDASIREDGLCSK